ncbi:unnamed protein product [Lota lota]
MSFPCPDSAMVRGAPARGARVGQSRARHTGSSSGQARPGKPSASSEPHRGSGDWGRAAIPSSVGSIAPEVSRTLAVPFPTPRATSHF